MNRFPTGPDRQLVETTAQLYREAIVLGVVKYGHEFETLWRDIVMKALNVERSRMDHMTYHLFSMVICNREAALRMLPSPVKTKRPWWRIW